MQHLSAKKGPSKRGASGFSCQNYQESCFHLIRLLNRGSSETLEYSVNIYTYLCLYLVYIKKHNKELFAFLKREERRKIKKVSSIKCDFECFLHKQH